MCLLFESIFGNGIKLKCLIRAERVQFSVYVISQDGERRDEGGVRT